MSMKTIEFIDGDLSMSIHISIDGKAWLSQSDISLLYKRSLSTVSYLINKIFDKDTLTSNSCYANFDVNFENIRRIETRKKRYYNSTIVIALGNYLGEKRGEKLKVFLDDYFNSKSTEISNDIIIYNNGDVSIDVRISPQENTVWVSQDKIAKLYDSSKQVISYHIKNILEDEELDRSVVKEILTTGLDGKTYSVSYYNLDMVISIGYRINSKKGIAFRKWATSTLKEYLMKGYLINKERTLITSENYLNLINKVGSLEDRVSIIEEKQNVLFLEDKVIYEGTVFDAIVLINKFTELAHKSITLIDPYIDVKTLDAFKNKESNISLFIITSSNNRLSENERQAFIEQYGGLYVYLDDRYHDRYLIIDDNYFYHLGSSINYLGKHFSQITLIKDADIKVTLKKRVMAILPN